MKVSAHAACRASISTENLSCDLSISTKMEFPPMRLLLWWLASFVFHAKEPLSRKSHLQSPKIPS